MRPRARHGFTLIELLISIVIIGLLAVIALNVFWRAKDRGLESAMKSDLRSASMQQERYFEQHLEYTSVPADLPDFELSPGSVLAINHAAKDGWAGVVSHTSITLQCGLFVGAAPAGTAGPATQPGVINCGEP